MVCNVNVNVKVDYGLLFPVNLSETAKSKALEILYRAYAGALKGW